jgi:hypothetical protein
MFYICIPDYIINNPNIKNSCYINILVDCSSIDIDINSSNIINGYHFYKIEARLYSGITYKIKTLNNIEYYEDIILMNNNLYYNEFATFYNEVNNPNETIVKINNTIIELN